MLMLIHIIFLIFSVVDTTAGELEKYLNLDRCATFTGVITKVIDGDTLDITLDDKATRTRLLGIDAPERDEFGWQEATDFLAKYKEKKVTIYYSKRYMHDIYNRLLGVIVVDDEILNIKLLQEGLAKRCFFKNDILRFEEWESTEISARKSKHRIWQFLGTSGIFITEIHPNPAYIPEYREYEAEFIELHNTNVEDIDLYHWRLEIVGDKLVIDRIIIEGGSFVVISGEAFSRLYPIPPKDVEVLERFNEKLNLPNNDYCPIGGHTIYLYDPAGKIVDAMVYNLQWEGGKLNNTGYTLEKKNLGACNWGDSRVNGEDDNNWDASLKVGGSPGYVNTVNVGTPTIGTITKSGTPTKTLPGGTITYTIKCHVNKETCLVVRDYLPKELIFISSTPKHSTFTENYYEWNLGTATPCQWGTITIIAKVATDTKPSTYIRNTAELLECRRIPLATATFSIHVDTPTIGTIIKTGTPTKVLPGGTVTYTINYHVNKETCVVVRDYLPTELIFISTSTPAYSTFTGNYYEWNLGTITPCRWGTITITAKVATDTKPCTYIRNIAELLECGRITLATATFSIHVDTPTIGTITKSGTPTEILPRGTITYTIKYHVNKETCLVVRDYLPKELIFISSTPKYSTFTGDYYEWNLGTATPCIWATITITAKVVSHAKPCTFIKNRVELWECGKVLLGSATCYVHVGTPTFAPTLADLIVYPNPCILSKGHRYIYFDKLTQGATIRIYDLSGALIKEIKVDNSKEEWDVQAEGIASGVYIYIVKDDKKHKIGKLAIIR